MSDHGDAFSLNDPGEDDFARLAPSEPAVDEQRRLALAEARRLLFRAQLPRRRAPKRLQYTLAEVAALVTFAAVSLSCAHYLSLPAFAGLAGAAAVAFMLCDHLIPPRWRWLRAGWVALAVTYVVAAGVAVVRG